ncbi:uncharacterized protein BDW43DRAFT_263514 [Aspergillus alliaceus]|uniref:uncharacterized protein n=1 Tax=Petromyces alliaceus TaxID=209559 RepID=UPI0012A526D1|nr:uncharacterized protein BDW43DRAFT_263514 [Aspergillus alliaceus]KAB8237498.1 hypothetical protein BDW43DRAFT_263514 [Aspergillus alliaceus]
MGCLITSPSESSPLNLTRGNPYSSYRNVSNRNQPTMFGGLLFGFRSLGFSNGFSVAGFHLHFLSDDCNAGGHVTRLEAWDAKLSAAVIKEYRVRIHQEESHEVPIGDRAIKVNTRC